jgi:hypothetical protein
MLSSAIMVLNIELGDDHLLPGGHTPLWSVAGVSDPLGWAMLNGSTQS